MTSTQGRPGLGWETGPNLPAAPADQELCSDRLAETGARGPRDPVCWAQHCPVVGPSGPGSAINLRR